MQSLLVVLLLGAGGLAALVARRNDRSLVRILATDDSGAMVAGVSYPLYLDYRSRATTFVGLAAYFDSLAIVIEWDNGATELTGALVSGNFFEVLGARPLLGRTIMVDDERRGADPVIVLSHHVWRRSLLGDTTVLGRTLRLNGAAVKIVGVMPPGFHDATAGAGPDLWAPISAVGKLSPTAGELQPLRRRGLWWLSIVGRLAPHATIDDARAQLEAISAELDTTRSLDPRPRIVPFDAARPRTTTSAAPAPAA